MARVKGAYQSLVRGVSEQVPHDRLEGQHFEQVNFLSDPIRGLVRRHGSRYRAKLPLSSPGPLTPGDMDIIRGFKEQTLEVLGKEYSVLYNSRPDPGGDVNVNRVVCYNKDDHEFLPVVSHNAFGSMVDGITSVVNVGRYILMSRRGFVPTYTTSDRVAVNGGRASVWVRGGAYSRVFSLVINNVVCTHETMPSYYEGVLDTSDIDFEAEDYQKQVNDRVNAYNTAVNQHIAASQESITPAAIAIGLINAINEASIPGVTATRRGSHILLNGVDTIVGRDGGDSQYIRITHRRVGAAEELTQWHWVGTTIAVEVTERDVYYVTAHPVREGHTGWQEVVWREGPGIRYTPTNVFLIGTVHNGEFHLANTPANLAAATGLDVPTFQPSSAGDEESSPIPELFKRPIGFMTLLQDRLVICAGASVFMSRPGDYFNFFRRSVLRVNEDDPLEVFALGAEYDTIRSGAYLDRTLYLLGDQNHYVVPARDTLTASNAVVSVQARHEGTADVAPEALGGYLFYVQYRAGITRMHQVQSGDFTDTFRSFPVSQQLSRYIEGRPRQLVASTQPSMVLMSTDAQDHGLYVYTFLDSPGEDRRLFDSWSRWEWDPSLGTLVAATESSQGFVVFTIRECADGWYYVADEFSREGAVPDYPYMDSRAPYSELSDWPAPVGSEPCVVLPRSHPRSLFGASLEDADRVLSLSGVSEEDPQVGVQFSSYVDLTAPYLRDREDNPVLSGRHVLSRLTFSLQESGGIQVKVAGRDREYDQTVLDDTGFRIGDPLVSLGSVPVLDRQTTAHIGREIREHFVRVLSRSWTPLNIATIEWMMQSFNRRR